MKELAKKYNVLESTISKRMNIMNKTISSEIDIDKLRNYIEKNPSATLEELGLFFNVNRRVIQDAIKAYDINYTRKKPIAKKLNVDELRAFIEQNQELDRKDIAKVFNISVGTIDNYIKKHDLPYKPKPGRKKKTFRN